MKLNLRGALIAASLLALAAGATAFAAVGFPGLQSMFGAMVDVSTGAPVIVQAGQTISGQHGGANVGVWIATGATTAAGTLTFPDAAPTGRFCTFTDETTHADTVTQGTATNGQTVVTIIGTIVSADQIAYQCDAF